MFQSTIIVDPKSEIKGKQSFDTYIVKPTTIDRRTSIRIKEVQDMLAWCSKSAFQGSQKLVVIEELHKASNAVPHALLKLLEEPPADTRITMTIDRAESTLGTIRSRCGIVAAHDLDVSQLEQLGLRQVALTPHEAAISWHNLAAQSKIDRTNWIADIVKSKKDYRSLVVAWQAELVEELAHQNKANRPHLIKQLALLEEVGAALDHNVLPRLALHYLNLRLDAYLTPST